MDLSNLPVANKMSALIMKNEAIKEARVYFALRFLDQTNQGNLPLRYIYNQLSSKSSSTYLLERRYLKDRIKAGEGIFWFIKDNRLWLLGLEKIMFKLGADSFGKYASDLSFADVFSSHKRFKRSLYEIVHCVENDHPIARETIRALTGLGRKAQRNLEGHICVEENFARTNLYWNDKNTEALRWSKPHMFKIYTKDRGRTGSFIAFQIANTYTPFERETKQLSGSMRKKAQKLRVLNGNPGRERDEEQESKLVYGTTDKEIDILLDGNKRTKFTYYFRNGKWKAVLPTDLYEETFNHGYDEISAEFAKLGICLPSGDDDVAASVSVLTS